jgi:hypothetical protein
VKASYDNWRDELLRFWPDAQVRGHPVVRAHSMGMVVGEWSSPLMFWVKTPLYKVACLDARQQDIWEQTIGGTARRASVVRPSPHHTGT